MLRLIFSFVFSACIVSTSGQDTNTIDSLQKVEIVKPEERFSFLVEHSIAHLDLDKNLALRTIQEAEKLAWLSGDSAKIVQSLRIKGQILYRLERSDETIQIFKRASSIAIRGNFNEELMMIANTFGSTYLFRSEFDKALRQYFAAYELAEALRNSIFISSTLHNIGITYYKLKDYRKAIHFFKQAYQMKKGDDPALVMTALNISLSYANLNELENSEKYFTEALKGCAGKCDDKYMLHIKYASGYILYVKKRDVDARKEFLQSFDYSQKVGNTRMQLDNIYMLADIYHKNGEFDKAIAILQQGEVLINAGAPFNMEVIKVYSRFAEVFLDMKEFEKGAFYQAKYIQLKDSVYSESLTTGLMETEAQFLERENTSIIKAQRDNLALNEEVIVRREILIVVFGLLGVITFAFLLFLFRSYRDKRRINRILDQKVWARTRELDMNRSQLLRELSEKDIVIQQVCGGITETVSTIEGLCFVATKEIGNPVADIYLKKIYNTACCLSACLPVRK